MFFNNSVSPELLIKTKKNQNHHDYENKNLSCSSNLSDIDGTRHFMQ